MLLDDFYFINKQNKQWTKQSVSPLIPEGVKLRIANCPQQSIQLGPILLREVNIPIARNTSKHSRHTGQNRNRLRNWMIEFHLEALQEAGSFCKYYLEALLPGHTISENTSTTECCLWLLPGSPYPPDCGGEATLLVLCVKRLRWPDHFCCIYFSLKHFFFCSFCLGLKPACLLNGGSRQRG